MTQPESLTFREVVLVCFANREFMEQYRRLSGSRLGLDERTPIEKMIDSAVGYQGIVEGEALLFFTFVHDVVWSRIPRPQ